jgi:hypothetical protein
MIKRIEYGQYGWRLVDDRSWNGAGYGLSIAGAVMELPPVEGGWRRFLFQPDANGVAQDFAVNQVGHWFTTSGVVSVGIRPDQVPEKVRRMATMKVVRNEFIRTGDLNCSHPDRCVIAENRGSGCLTVSVICRTCDAKQLVSVSHSNADGDEQLAEEIARVHAWA